MYGYDIFMSFYAGSTDVNSDVVITNNFTRSIGSPTFKDASLLLKLKGGASAFTLLGDKDKATEGKLAGSESACLYQDSNGTDTWESCSGFADMQSNGWHQLKTKLTSFRGYKVLKRADGKETDLSAGDHASGVLHAINDKGGLIVHMRNFWQQFPKAAEVSADGTVRVGLFPGEFAAVHYLEDGAAKGHEIVLHFYRAGAKDAYEASPAAVAAAWDIRTFPRPDIKHICATGALVDLGPYTVPKHGMDKKPSNQVAIDAPRALSDDRLYGNALGWQIFGERWRSNGGHSQHGARQPIKEDDYLYQWYVTGLPEWLAVGDARSRQFRDVRSYRIDGQEPFDFKDWDDFAKSNLREGGWCKRPQPNDAEYQKYRDGFWPRSAWEFPNPEHTTLDLIYDRAMLFGDMRAYENMRVIAANGGFYAIKAAPTIMRFTGWGWRAIERYWELAGDKQAEALLRRTLKAFTPLIGKGPLAAPIADPDPSDYKSWHTMIWNRPLAMTALHLGDPEAIALAKTAAEGHEDKADYYCTLFAVLYHLTGEQKYKDAVLKASNDGDKISVVRDVEDKNWSHMGHVFPCSALWLLEQPPVKK
jgi:hypothetical protein